MSQPTTQKARLRDFSKRSTWLVLGLLCVFTVLPFTRVIAEDEGEEPGANGSPFGIQQPISDIDGHPTFASPHSNPIELIGDLVYVVNTPADTLDVISTDTSEVVFRVNVGIDPVSVAIRPDGAEAWVSNHVSDTISVIDLDPESRFYHQIIATVQDVNPYSFSTQFDEPVGIAFANNEKAYVALGPANEIAVINVVQRRVAKRLKVNAQDPRAILVDGNRLYVTAFESGNKSQISGCNPQDLDGDVCTYDAVQETHTTNNVLSLGFDADIVKNNKVPDRDLFIYSTVNDRLFDVVEGAGTLIYGLAVDGDRNVYIAQADARNVDNGRAGTLKHGLAEMENRAFLNQITRINCNRLPCEDPEFLELEPLPPDHPEQGMALATPFAVQISDDDATLIATAAGSDKVFTLDLESGEVIGRVDVGHAPRGLVVTSNEDGSPAEAWVMNAVANTVSRIDLSSLSEPELVETIALEDPTPPLMKLGRIAFNDADASTTGTFSCESCHPDNNVDQLLWILDTPICNHPGCTQIPPRLTMPVRGLRDTQPYHWDGIPGDPYGGINVQSLWEPVEPNCDLDNPESCTRHLVDGSLGTTMCDVATSESCPVNDGGNLGALTEEVRDALAHYILNVPFPPAPNRPFDNELSASAKTGFFEFNYLNDSGLSTGSQACGACHKPPFLTTTNTPSNRNVQGDVGSFNGMDAPTWRGAYDRWIVTPQARFNAIDLIERIGMDLEGDIPEQEVWFHAGARTQANWDMVLEYGTGFSGTFARQVTLNESTVESDSSNRILDALIAAARSDSVLLHGDGIFVDPESDESQVRALEFSDGSFVDRTNDEQSYTLDELKQAALDGNLVLTFTARMGANVLPEYPQPAIWPFWTMGQQTYDGVVQQSPTVEIAMLSDDFTLTIKGRHIQPESLIFVNGHRVEGEVSCEVDDFPSCAEETIVVSLDEAPTRFGLNFLQLQTPAGMMSNDIMFFSEQTEKPIYSRNLIVSGGSFDRFEFPLQRFWNTVEIDGNDVFFSNQRINARINVVNESQPWRAQISHTVSVVAEQEYSLCFRAKADADRIITAYLDRNMHGWQNLSGGQFESSLTRFWQDFHYTFTVNQTDHTARVAFDLAQARPSIQLDDIGFYEGDKCGNSGIPEPIGFHTSGSG